MSTDRLTLGGPCGGHSTKQRCEGPRWRRSWPGSTRRRTPWWPPLPSGSRSPLVRSSVWPKKRPGDGPPMSPSRCQYATKPSCLRCSIGHEGRSCWSSDRTARAGTATSCSDRWRTSACTTPRARWSWPDIRSSNQPTYADRRCSWTLATGWTRTPSAVAEISRGPAHSGGTDQNRQGRRCKGKHTTRGRRWLAWLTQPTGPGVRSNW